MGRMSSKLTYANVMATVAVFIALGGASYAATRLPKNSVGTRQLKKGAVSTAKIMDQAITAAKIQNGALTGAQINASTLGAVPDASHATSAVHAATADSATHAATAASAADAATLDGRNASDFAPDSEVQTPGRVVLDDAPGGEPAQATLAVAGGFTITGYCDQNYSGEKEFASVIMTGPVASSYSGWFLEGNYGNLPGNPNVFSEALLVGPESAEDKLESWDVVAVAPTSEVVHTTGSAEVNSFEESPAGDCVFGATTIGP
jgi:hypothetical protein